MKLITKELTEDFKNKQLIEKRIAALKEDFMGKRYSRTKGMYEILRNIIKLKRELGLDYKISHLVKEEGLKLNHAQIRYIFSIEYLSSKSKTMIKEKQIMDSTVCAMIWRFRFLREAQWQDKLVEAYLKGDITMGEVGELNVQDLKHFLKTGKKLYSNERYLITASKTLRGMASRLNRHKIDKKSDYYKHLITSVKKLEMVLNDK